MTSSKGFRTVGFFDKGYAKDEVDDFLHRAKEAYNGPLTPNFDENTIRNAAFHRQRRGYLPADVDEALDRLEAAGVIDDAAYAARLTRTRFAEKGAARRAIAEELRRRGLGEQDVATALGQIDSDDEDSAALALARKKLSATRHLPWEVRRRRTAALLGRKGYSREATVRALEAAFAEESD